MTFVYKQLSDQSATPVFVGFRRQSPLRVVCRPEPLGGAHSKSGEPITGLHDPTHVGGVLRPAGGRNPGTTQEVRGSSAGSPTTLRLSIAMSETGDESAIPIAVGGDAALLRSLPTMHLGGRDSFEAASSVPIVQPDGTGFMLVVRVRRRVRAGWKAFGSLGGARHRVSGSSRGSA